MAKKSVAPLAKKRTHRTQAERKSDTRARLLAVGRQHFLRRGLTDASGEAIAEEAGFSRGALHANFGDKDGLFLEVVRMAAERSWESFDQAYHHQVSTEARRHNAQDFFANLLSDPNFQLSVELMLQAIHHPKLKNGYRSLHRQRSSRAKPLLDQLLAELAPGSLFTAEELVIVLMSTSYGLAAMQRLLGSELTAGKARKLLSSVFSVLLPAQ